MSTVKKFNKTLEEAHMKLKGNGVKTYLTSSTFKSSNIEVNELMIAEEGGSEFQLGVASYNVILDARNYDLFLVDPY